ncbi:hypothetical protein [Agrobacterium cavarae]|uniref:hypothetical protein n=1 Tax=Agrobacterium cavarae TaxID=2528239 RepID=UPI002FDA5F0C
MDDQKPISRHQQKKANREAILMDAKKPLTEGELARLERMKRSVQNRRGRKQPSVMPAKLARTSAFAPRRKGLITDSNFMRVYEVPGYSVVEVRGRELGSQHRDAIYALFRLPRAKISMPNPSYKPRTFTAPTISCYETRTTWRELLKVMGKGEHVNNLLSLLNTFQEIQQVSLTIHQGSSIEELEKIRKSRAAGVLPDTAGSASPIIKELSWDGAQLDSGITVQYGTSVLEMIEKAYLVSINAEVQFRLKSDHAKTFWPFIDSQPNHSYIDEERLAHLAGRSLWAEDMTSAHRAQFRKECREAFNDMRMAGGLREWREEVTGSGRNKSRRYHYVHASPRQLEMDLIKTVSQG